MPGSFNFEVSRGSVFSHGLLWAIAGTPVDLNGWTGTLTVVWDYGVRRPPLLTLTTENGGIEFLPGGEIRLVATAEQTLELPTGVFVYSLFLYNTDDAVNLLAGRWRTRDGNLKSARLEVQHV